MVDLISARINTSVLDAHVRKRIEPIFRKSIIMGMLKKRGKIVLGGGSYVGKQLKWHPRFKRRKIVGNQGGITQISFPITVTKKEATLPWRSYYLGEGVTKIEELLSANSDTALFKILKDAADEASDDFVADFATKFYANGNTAGSTDVHGLESLFDNSGAVISNGMVAASNSTYAGLNQTLGNYGGEWSPPTGENWPKGTGDTHYCAWSPMIWDAHNAKWTAATKTWPNVWQELVAFAISYAKVIQDTNYDIVLVSTDYLNQAKQSLNTNQRFTTTADSEAVKLGFKTVSYEGVEFYDEYGIPESTAYFLNFDHIELISLQKQLVAMEQQKDLATSTTNMRWDFYGNIRFDSPAHFAKTEETT